MINGEGGRPVRVTYRSVCRQSCRVVKTNVMKKVGFVVFTHLLMMTCTSGKCI